ncbi:dihydroorotase [Ferruginibacter lapsinanis]|uniref:dihydroorotase n=1 Tax=Ferruginibacter lapsinanis TaxID=563172 RepID=UPI001E313D8D|nr:dihydroorotase [Ferruginibacter lapsinanis]UEG49514.1 dihydroorotase [Ferruginibacter lapsinanis]
MKLLIKQAKIADSSSPFNGQTKDIFIVDGIISKIADSISEQADKTIQANDLHVSTGWMDVFSHFCDPGFEYRETIETGAAAAAAGGFTDVLILPNTNPVIGSKSQVEYVVQKSRTLAVNVHPIGAITKNTEGKELTEMYDMQQSGAVAFSDGNNSVQSPGILLKALQYLTAVDGIIIQIPDDKTISPQGLINEGVISTQLGLPGKPAIAEELMIARDIELVRYTNAKIHFTGVSTQKSIELITKAKAEGLNITCSVTPYHLLFNDEDLTTYDTNLKVNPPIRNKANMMALRKALQDGSIDCIASHHIPQNKDSKICEFEHAKNGMIGLETLYGAVSQIISTEKCVEILTIAPRKIFGLPINAIKEQATAKLTLFTPDTTFTFEENMIRSKSKNSAFTGKQLKGKVIGIVNGNNIVVN